MVDTYGIPFTAIRCIEQISLHSVNDIYIEIIGRDIACVEAPNKKWTISERV